MEYSGSFSVKNCTGKTVYDVRVAHYAKNPFARIKESVLKAEQLRQGESLSNGKLHTAQGLSDYWDVEFSVETENGQALMYAKRYEKMCDYEQEDIHQNCVVELKLDGDKLIFSIVPPVSSPCLDNWMSATGRP